MLQKHHVVWDDNCGKASMGIHSLHETQALGRPAWDDKFGEDAVLRFAQDDNLLCMRSFASLRMTTSFGEAGSGGYTPGDPAEEI